MYPREQIHHTNTPKGGREGNRTRIFYAYDVLPLNYPAESKPCTILAIHVPSIACNFYCETFGADAIASPFSKEGRCHC